MSKFPGTICKGCKNDDRLYEDSHGIFCSRCGPSVPMTRGLTMGRGTMQLHVDGKPIGEEYTVRDMCMWLEESESARIHSQDP